MKNNAKNIKNASLLTGVILTGSLTAMAAAGNTNNLMDYDVMGSGSEVRGEINSINVPNIFPSETTIYFAELKCGEGKCGEGKCGEGKCGEDDKKDMDKKAKMMKDKKADMDKMSEGKCGEGKCGEGKCGSHDSDMKDKKDEKKKKK